MKNIVVNVLLRLVFGTIGLLLCNDLLSNLGWGIYMGMNLVNLLTIGTLGISGFMLVFVISLFAIL